MVKTVSLFDYAIAQKGGKKTTRFLEEMKELIPFDEIERILIEKGLYRPRGKRSGRPPYPAKVLIGAMFLQAWYNLSDPMTEELIHDRISFRKFLDIKDEDDIPDETTLCNFRNRLIDAGIFETIFTTVALKMQEKGLILKEGTLVDATLVHSSEPKRKKDTNGRVVKNEAADKDASYTSKRGKKYHGYKMHIATDRRGMIKKVRTTTAKESDIKQLNELTKEETSAIVGDSAYMSKEIKRRCRNKGITYGIIERKVKNQHKLHTNQRKHNARFAAVRAVVELPFAFIKHLMGYTHTRFIGITKNTQYHMLLATAYNLRRIPSLERKLGIRT